MGGGSELQLLLLKPGGHKAMLSKYLENGGLFVYFCINLLCEMDSSYTCFICCSRCRPTLCMQCM
jgi:hypothetical protein